MFQFDQVYLLALLPLPLLVYWLVPEHKEAGEAVKVPFITRIIDVTGQQLQQGDVLVLKSALQKLTALLCWVLVIVALAKPVQILEPIVEAKSGRDLLLIIDLSKSMETADFTTEDGASISRLEAVKQVVGDFVEKRENDRIGLAVFGSAAFPQVPFTEDHKVLLSLLADLQPGMAGAQTVIGDGIGLGLKMFESSESENKVAILLTDGNDTGSKMPVAKAAEIASSNNITIHTIAMGDPTTVGEFALDTARLEDISAITGGEYFLALNSAELGEIYATLDRLEVEKVESVQYNPKKSLFHYPLIGGLLIFSLFLMISLWPRGRGASV